MTIRSDELQLETVESFQRTEWRVQRVGWSVWSLVVFAGLIGLLRPGPLSETEVIATDGSLSVAYDRYLHYHHPTQLKLLVGKTADNERRVKFDRTLLDQLQVERIEPEPLKAELADEGVIYTFRHKRYPKCKSHLSC